MDDDSNKPQKDAIYWYQKCEELKGELKSKTK
jgi:hypothetical protein